jgi:outer membrane receptor protein involved in Fe transport
MLGLTLLPTALVGQAANTTDQEQIDQDVYLMSPFEVTASPNEGYGSTQTLAGTRIRTDLSDLANAISVVNTQFLKDTGATSSTDLLVYTANTEIGGVFGNFSGAGHTSSYNANANLVSPTTNNRVRGLAAADNTQNYFLSNAPWDSYNVDRVEMQRGANSILFGVGSAAGIINTLTKPATFVNGGNVETRIGSYGSFRGSVDVNKVLVDELLSVRVIGLYNDTKYQQKPAFNTDKRIYGAIRFEPKLFGKSAFTSFRANYEHGDVKANRPRILPPIDNISSWFWKGTSVNGHETGVPNLNKSIYDPWQTYNYFVNNPKWHNSLNTGNGYPWLTRNTLVAAVYNSPNAYYDLLSDKTAPVMLKESGALSVLGAVGPDGKVDNGIAGIDDFSRMGISGFSSFATLSLPGGSYYSDYSMSDASIFDFYNNLLDGDNKKEWQNWDSVNASVSQTFMDNRFGFDLSYFYQTYEDGQETMLGSWFYGISVDIYNKQLDGMDNPYAGRPYVTGTSSGNVNTTNRNSFRGTAFVDLRSTDLLEESWLTRILGHHMVSFLGANDIKDQTNRNYRPYSYDVDYANAINQQDSSGLADFPRQYSWLAYIGPSLIGNQYTSASGLNLTRLTSSIQPQTNTVSVKYFSPVWNGAATGATSYGQDGYVYYRHDYMNGNTTFPGDITTNTATQSENPANYVGWTNGTFDVLSVNNGDIDRLSSNIHKERTTVTSYGATLQSYMLDDCLVGTYGYRKDRVKTVNGAATIMADDVADPRYRLNNAYGSTTTNYSEGISRTWGLVLHTPEFINNFLPFGTKLSVFYGEGENFQATAPRGDLMGNQIANQGGTTKDYGFGISVLDGRITLKTTWYKTSVTDADLPSSGHGGLGDGAWWFYGVPLNETPYALSFLDVCRDDTPASRLRTDMWPWMGNFNWSGDYNVPGTIKPTEQAKQIMFARVKDYFENFPFDQSYMDAYGIPVNVAKMHEAGKNAVYANQSTWNAFYDAMPWYATSAGANNFNYSRTIADTLKGYGQATATCDTTSKGIEWELTAKITDNWNLMVNVSKTDAKISAVSPTVIEAMDKMTNFLKGPAGDLCIWGSEVIRDTWKNNVGRPFQTLMNNIGNPAAEISPWRANIVTNYTFTEGMFNGVNVGLGYRWEDKRILGYQYDAATDALDVSKPWYGPTDDHFDAWVGYSRKLNDKLNWKVQLNVRNIGESAGLYPLFIQPDGTTGYSRITEGMNWFLTNTFEF